MTSTLPQMFIQLIKVVSNDSIFKRIITFAQKKYSIKQLNLSNLSPPLIVKLVSRNLQKPSSYKVEKSSDCSELYQMSWALNQFKIFTWVSVCYSYINNKQLENFNFDDFVFLQSLFTRKSIQFLEYHIKSLIKELSNEKRQWNTIEEQLLIDIIKSKEYSLVWSQISFLLYHRSSKLYLRSPQKCRERWLNHLSPKVHHQKFSLQEDSLLFKSIIEYGTKWALISKLFNGTRTQHMIKNRYNSFIKKYEIKCHRTPLKKLIEKIFNDLNKKLNRISLRNKNNNAQAKIEVQNQESLSDQSINYGAYKNNNHEKQTNEQILGLDKLISLDLEQMIICSNIKMEINNQNIKMKLVQDQLDEQLFKIDQDLSELLY